MASRTFHFKHVSIVKGDIKVDIKLDRFEKQFQLAQKRLDQSVMLSMEPFMPKQTGQFINLTKARSKAMEGSGTVVAAAPPYGRFLYEGKVMVDELTGSPWARKGAKKVVTDRTLQFSKAAYPKATDHWFDAAKEADCENWVKIVKETAGGGERG